MKNKFSLCAAIFSCMAILGCSHDQAPSSSDAKIDSESTAESNLFTVEEARANLSFSKDQYLKLLGHINADRHLKPKPACTLEPSMICVPRSEEHDGIYLEESEKWTNGFFPGVLWKLLASHEEISNWSEGEEESLLKSAKYYQASLESEAERGTTHDLGFILYDSFGEALAYDKLDEETREHYLKLLELGRATLATRYTDEVGLIRSWDWIPRMRISTLEEGERVDDLYTLSNPWTYPVIVDNMMNLEFLFDSDSQRYHEIAFNHAKYTSLNHYFYDESDINQQYPLAYHVFDYGSSKPGNWQGVGNVSAWARGQGWSLYGYVTVVEAMQKANIDLSDYPDFKAHLNRVFGSVEYLLQDGLVPYWDYFAVRENAYEYAENVSDDTAVFSGILVLCEHFVEDHILPYVGYRPIVLNKSILSSESLQRLEGKQSLYGEPVIQGEELLACGSKPYQQTGTKIPRDTSAAAIYAAAMYRYATFTNDPSEKEKFAGLADQIMAELSAHYRTDRAKNGRPESYELGFVLAEATGDMGKGSELDTPIVYADFYFIEANIRKIEYEQSK